MVPAHNLQVSEIDQTLALVIDMIKTVNKDNVSGVEAIKDFIQKLPDVNVRNHTGATVLHWVAAHGLDSLVPLLVEMGANLEIEGGGNLKSTPLMVAIMTRNWSTAKLLLLNGASLTPPSEIHPVSHAMIVGAAQLRDKKAPVATLKELLNVLPDINVQDFNKRTALHVAAAGDLEEIVAFLIERGARLDIQDHVNATPLEAAYLSNSWNALKLLAEAGTVLKPDVHLALLIHMIKTIDEENEVGIEAIKIFIKNMPDVNQLDKNGRTALHWAAGRGFDPIVSCLIAAGIALDIEDSVGGSPLMLACYQKNWNTSRLLIEAGAKLNPPKSKEITLFHFAVFAIIRRLVKFKRDLDELGSKSKTVTLLSEIERLSPRSNEPIDEFEVVELNAALQQLQQAQKGTEGEGESLQDLKLMAEQQQILQMIEQQQQQTELELVKRAQEASQAEQLRAVPVVPRVKLSDAQEIEAIRSINNDIKSIKESEQVNMAVLEAAIKLTPDLNIPDEYGRTPLHYAAERGLCSIISVLVDGCAHIEARDFEGNTPLMLAVAKQQYQAVERLIELGADMNAADKEDELLVKKPDPLKKIASNPKKEAGKASSPWVSVSLSVSETDERALTAVANVVPEDTIKAHVALEKTTAVTKKVLGPKELQMAIQALNERMLKVAEKDQSEVEEISAIIKGVPDTFINTKDKNAKTLLHHAAERGLTSIVSLLIDKKADLECRDTSKTNPMLYAFGRKQWETARLLTQAKADVTAKSANGMTVLHMAARDDSLVPLMSLLIENKADVNAVEPQAGTTPIFGAFGFGGMAAIVFLIRSQANILVKTKTGLTCLHFAAKADKVGIIPYLIENGVELNAKNDKGNTPLQFAEHANPNSDSTKLLKIYPLIDFCFKPSFLQPYVQQIEEAISKSSASSSSASPEAVSLSPQDRAVNLKKSSFEVLNQAKKAIFENRKGELEKASGILKMDQEKIQDLVIKVMAEHIQYFCLGDLNLQARPSSLIVADKPTEVGDKIKL